MLNKKWNNDKHYFESVSAWGLTKQSFDLFDFDLSHNVNIEGLLFIPPLSLLGLLAGTDLLSDPPRHQERDCYRYRHGYHRLYCFFGTTTCISSRGLFYERRLSLPNNISAKFWNSTIVTQHYASCFETIANRNDTFVYQMKCSSVCERTCMANIRQSINVNHIYWGACGRTGNLVSSCTLRHFRRLRQIRRLWKHSFIHPSIH